MFRTLLNTCSVSKRRSPVGSATTGIYKAVTESDGNRKLVQVGVRNIYEEIQSFAHEVDISRIVTRFEGGDSNAFNVRAGAYLDTTVFPENMHEAYKVIRDTENIYNSLSVDDRRFFGTFGEFLEKFQNLENIKDYFVKKKVVNGEVDSEK